MPETVNFPDRSGSCWKKEFTGQTKVIDLHLKGCFVEQKGKINISRKEEVLGKSGVRITLIFTYTEGIRLKISSWKRETTNHQC